MSNQMAVVRPSRARPVIWRVAAVLLTLAGCAASGPVEVSTSQGPPATTTGEALTPAPADPEPGPSSSTTIPAATATTADGRLQVASRRRPPTTTSTTHHGPASTTTTSSVPVEPATTTTTIRYAGDGTVVEMAATPDGTSGWLLTSDGTVRALGAAKHLGDGSRRLAAPAVEIAPTRSGRGYFITTAAGEVFVFGDAVHAGNLPRGYQVTGMVPDPDGYGYWMVTPDGYFMTFQEWGYGPSPGPPDIRKTPIVAIAADPPHGDGAGSIGGCHPVTSGGEVLGYGSWAHYGQPRPEELTAPIVDIAATPTGQGYTLVDAAGHVYPYGDAAFHGHANPTASVVSIVITPSNRGYWITTADGTILTFGDALDIDV